MADEGKEAGGPETNDLQRDLRENFPHLISLQITLSSIACWTLFPLRPKKNLHTSSISQSLNGLEKSGLQLHPPSLEHHTSLTQASLKTAKEKKEGKETQRGSSPHHLSFQNFTPSICNQFFMITLKGMYALNAFLFWVDNNKI